MAVLEPHLFTDARDMERIRAALARCDWYAASYENIRACADEAIARGIRVPREKGFVFFETCPRDNTRLMFDMYDDEGGVCPKCGMVYRDEAYRRAKSTAAHHWASQLAIKLGICYQVSRDEKYARALRRMLLDYLEVYAGMPNDDNELGPTKLFQSTYMEGVWATHMGAGYDMVRGCDAFSRGERDRIENEIFRVAAETIMDYDEGRNNRQAFNNAGVCAVAYLLDDARLLRHVLHGAHGFVNHMTHSILSDGLWYEGDNYHFATVPSLVNIAELCAHNGLNLYAQQFGGHSIRALFDAPLLSLQPDYTFPSRKDSPYRNDMKTRWYAGLYEVAYARYGDAAYAQLLKTIYGGEYSEGSTLHSAAGIMDIFPMERSRRDRLDWRGFLNAVPELGDVTGHPCTRSVNMKGTGLAVLRDERTYLSLDYGDYGGGHGHPDRLNLSYFAGGTRWFTDYGTGNYYFDHLRYYRSTLGHNTLCVDGQNHLPVVGRCDFFGAQGGMLATRGTVANLAVGVDASRTLMHYDGLLIDVLSARSEETHEYRYILHALGELRVEGEFAEARLTGEACHFLSEVRAARCAQGVRATFAQGGEALHMRGAVACDINARGMNACGASARGEDACGENACGEDACGEDACGENAFGANAPVDVWTARAYGPPNRIPETFPVLLLTARAADIDFVGVFEAGARDGACGVLGVRVRPGEVEIERAGGRTLIVRHAADGVTLEDWREGALKAALRVCAEAAPESAADGCAATLQPLYDEGAQALLTLRNGAASQNAEFEWAGEAPEGAPGRVSLQSGETRELRVRLTPGMMNAGELSLSGALRFAKQSTPFALRKALAVVPRVEKRVPLFGGARGNFAITRADQFRRNERHWGGIEDLSLWGSAENDGENLLLKFTVVDDRVLFDGGKYACDNDGLQFYIDRRPVPARGVDAIGGVYAFALVPPVNQQCSKLRSYGKQPTDAAAIGCTAYRTDSGYEVLVAIPWWCIGGAPESGDLIGFDVLVNDRDRGHRRDLQGVWSGCRENERVYLQDEDFKPSRFGLLMFE